MIFTQTKYSECVNTYGRLDYVSSSSNRLTNQKVKTNLEESKPKLTI